MLALAGCEQPGAPVASAPPPPPAPVPFEQAVQNAGNAVLAATASGQAGRRTVVIDPLVNGVTGEQSVGTRTIGSELAQLARARYPALDVEPFSPQAVAASPIVVVGTFTPVNAQNQPAGVREAYRFCLVAADLKTGKTVAKSVARATPDGVRSEPAPVFAESPAWTEDPAIKSYIATCQATKVGDPIPPAYLNGIITAAMVSEAMEAYEAGRYREALDLYNDARGTPAGDQLRVYNGLYLTETKLGRRDEARKAFGDLVDYGLRSTRLGVKFLFRPASTAFVSDPRVSGAYDMWLHEIAERGARSKACLQVTGHTSASGSPALNERLSVLRAEYVKSRLEGDDPGLHGRTVATGAGSAKTLVGTGADDASDALDRRVEFAVVPNC